MNWRTHLAWPPLLLAAFAIGCGIGCGGVRPPPRTAAVVLNVSAKPKAGSPQAQSSVHVSVYDAGPDPDPAQAAGPFEQVDYSHLTDVIVWLEPVGDGAAPNTAAPPAGAPAPLELTIDVRHPSTAVHAASAGQQVVFRNGGDRPLSLYSVSDDNDFALPPIPPGAEGRYTVRGVGLIEVLADPARPPVVLVYAAPSSWAAAAQAGKTVTFNGVPPGRYRATAWHPRLPGTSVDLVLAPDQVSRATLAVGVSNLSTVGR